MHSANLRTDLELGGIPQLYLKGKCQAQFNMTTYSKHIGFERVRYLQMEVV